jgi:hypothetical protein
MAKRFPAATTAVVGCALALAAPAAAEPVDTGGSAESVVGDLKSQGYNVVINWLSGYDTVPLWACTVQDVNNPNAAPPTPGTFSTVYVDVTCPNHQDE